MSGAPDNFILEVFCQIHEIIAVSGHAYDQVPVVVRIGDGLGGLGDAGRGGRLVALDGVGLVDDLAWPEHDRPVAKIAPLLAPRSAVVTVTSTAKGTLKTSRMTRHVPPRPATALIV